MELTVYGPLRSATGGKRVSVDPTERTVEAVVRAFVDAYPRAASHLVDESGDLRPSVRVRVDGERAPSTPTARQTPRLRCFRRCVGVSGRTGRGRCRPVQPLRRSRPGSVG
ncbi:MoaD/ThiS family protein [Haloplanus salilacus]|uniref:MoaD/ThiS family protein n=1 Tax=Haloplanus salilacus TaxID=2949994 RepID=UPI0030D54487